MIKLAWIGVFYSLILPDSIPLMVIEEAPFDTQLECVTAMMKYLKEVDPEAKFLFGKCELREIKINIQEINIEEMVLNKNT